jgi:hypothetical protein
MGVLNQEAPQPLSVTVSVPKSSADSVVLREAATRTRVASVRQGEEQILVLKELCDILNRVIAVNANSRYSRVCMQYLC